MTTEPTKPKPRRRWLQYSLRTFFVLLTVFCVWLGWLTHKANEQRKAVAWVREMGGQVYYDYHYDEDGSFVDDAEPSGPKWLVQFLGVDYFQEVSTVGLGDTADRNLTPLAKLTSLKSAYLYSMQVREVQVEKLQQALPNCRIVWWLPHAPSPAGRGEGSGGVVGKSLALPH